MKNQQFNLLMKTSAKSFNDQKAMIKKVLAGKTVLCQHCSKPLFITLPEDKQPTALYCQAGCTHIVLDFI